MKNIASRPEIVMVGTGDFRTLYGSYRAVQAALAIGRRQEAFHAVTAIEMTTGADGDDVQVGVRLLKPGPDSFAVTIHPTAPPAAEPELCDACTREGLTYCYGKHTAEPELEPLWRLVPWRHVGFALVLLVAFFALVAGAVVAVAAAARVAL